MLADAGWARRRKNCARHVKRKRFPPAGRRFAARSAGTPLAGSRVDRVEASAHSRSRRSVFMRSGGLLGLAVAVLSRLRRRPAGRGGPGARAGESGGGDQQHIHLHTRERAPWREATEMRRWGCGVLGLGLTVAALAPASPAEAANVLLFYSSRYTHLGANNGHP